MKCTPPSPRTCPLCRNDHPEWPSSPFITSRCDMNLRKRDVVCTPDPFGPVVGLWRREMLMGQAMRLKILSVLVVAGALALSGGPALADEPRERKLKAYTCTGGEIPSANCCY